MKTKLSIVALLGLMLAIPSFAAVKDLYVAQSPAGGGAGSSCGGAVPISTLPAIWSSQIGPGSTIHLCGVFTSTGTLVTFQSNGSAGNPITLKFEAGAQLSAPVWTSQGAINANGRSYIVIDGGTNGIIQNTNNGTAFSSRQPSTAITMLACNNCEVKNLTIANLYVHQQCEASSGCDTALPGADSAKGIYFGGANVLIHNNICHDVGWCVLQSASKGDTNIQIYANEFYNMDHGIAFGAGPGISIPFILIYGNHFHDMANWDTGTADAYHHDGVHGFSTLNSGSVQVLYLYNNIFDGNEGNCCVTSWVFLEGGTSAGTTPWTNSTGTANIFNNVLVGSLDLGNGQVYVGAGTGHMILNNTFLVAKEAGGSCLVAGRNGTSGTTYNIGNNVFQGCDSMANVDAAVKVLNLDYNAYAHSTGAANPIFVWGSKQTNNFTQWQQMSGMDAHSINALSTTLALSPSGVPQTGFIGAGAGGNLTQFATGPLAPLASDITSAARLATGAWDIGAYNSGSIAPVPVPTPTPTPVPTPAPMTCSLSVPATVTLNPHSTTLVVTQVTCP